jgi:DegV family protein with EDD domain
MSKSGVAVVVDSSATLPPELVEKYDLHVIPLSVNWEGSTYKDGVDITPEMFYERLATTEELPSTSQPSAGEFRDLFGRLAETSDSILAILISEHLSGTVASAVAARQMMADFPIEIVDSRSASMGLGFMALEAARAVQQGRNLVEAGAAARALVPQMQVIFVVDTLEFLHRGGRIGGARWLVGSMLSMKPLLKLEDGQIEALASVRTKRKAILRALEIAEEYAAGRGPLHIAVMHAGADDEAQRMHDWVQEKLDPAELHMAEVSAVIGVHTGPGLVGMAYYTEFRQDATIG